MKPPPFRYHDPETLDQALDLLARLENAKLLAGGQSLMPMLNMRFVQPDHVIDLNRVVGLNGIRETASGFELGAMTRQCELESSAPVAARCPIMAEALRLVGHRQTRNRGTLGGSLCHLDPAAELPTVATALEATLRIAGRGGTRSLAMADFPAFYMTPALEPDELLTGVEFEAWPAGHGHAFVEFARRHGDFAIVGVAALMELAADGTIARARLVLGGVGPAPVRCAEAVALLEGAAPGEALFREATESCRRIEAMSDVHAPESYRRHLAATLAGRALHKAAERAAAP